MEEVLPEQVRAEVAPLLAELGIPFLDESLSAPAQGPQTTETAGLVDELERLALLHERGALTAEEYAAAKGKLLGV